MATVYVNPTSGNDSTGDGTSSAPWLTVSKANTETTTGDTVIIQAGTHTMTASTIADFVEARTYEGQLNSSNKVATILDCNGDDISGTDIGAASITISLKNLEFKNINTTDLSLVSAYSTINIGHTGMTLLFEGCIFDNIALGSSGSSNTAGWYGSLFGTEFVSGADTLTGSTVTFNKCRFSNLGKISGATAGCSGLTGFNTVDSADVTLTSCVVDFSDAGHGGGQVDQLTGSREFGNITTEQNITIRNSIIYMSSGSMQLTRHRQASGSNEFILDANYADNIFFGTYTLDSNANYTIDDVLTSDPKFVSVANNNFDLRPDVSPAINAGVTI